jgi:hypothetical protein
MPPKTKTIVKVVAIVALCVAVIAAAAFLVWYYVIAKKPTTKPTPTPTMQFVNGAWQGSFTVNFDSSMPLGAYPINDISSDNTPVPVIYPGYMTQNSDGTGYAPLENQTWGNYPSGASPITPQPNDVATTGSPSNTATIPTSFSTLNYSGYGDIAFV